MSKYPGPTPAGKARWRALQTLPHHPQGLVYLSLTEACERFAFFGTQTLLVLYMVGQLLVPGPAGAVIGLDTVRLWFNAMFGAMTPIAFASALYGLYSGGAYLFPALGGYLGDRVLGQRLCVNSGGLLMAVGHFLMAFEASFLIALVLLAIGSGLLKGNISVQVGRLYDPGDRRMADAFVIYSVGINLGILAAPLVCGTIGELLGYRYGFAAAGMAMLLALVIYNSGWRHLPQDRGPDLADSRAGPKFQPGDGRRIVALICILLIITTFMVAANQLGNIYMLWVKRFVDRQAFGFALPVTWFAAFTALPIVLLPPALLGFWQRLAACGREPSMTRKIAIGCGLCAMAFAGLAALAHVAARSGTVPWPWLIPFHVLIALAYLHIWPVGMALFADTAPRAITAMLLGCYFLSEFLSHGVDGRMGSLYEKLPAGQFWLLHAMWPAGGMVTMLLLGGVLNTILTPLGPPERTA